MNKILSDLLTAAVKDSHGQMTLLAENCSSILMGTPCGETIDLIIEKRMVKVLLVQLPENADAPVAFERIAPLTKVLDDAAAAGLLSRIVVYAQNLAQGTQDAIWGKAISSVELSTGAIKLSLPGYTFQLQGTPKRPSALMIESLITKRGKGLVEVLRSKPAGYRWTNQSIQAEVAAKSGKPISLSVVHRFITRTKELGLTVEMEPSGICLTEDGFNRLNTAFSNCSNNDGGGSAMEAIASSKQTSDAAYEAVADDGIRKGELEDPDDD